MDDPDTHPDTFPDTPPDTSFPCDLPLDWGTLWVFHSAHSRAQYSRRANPTLPDFNPAGALPSLQHLAASFGIGHLRTAAS